ncbi:bifunctional hydroxymethylpyrimidine kinase/phosphomethylpyrimidine kinase [Polyangium jinanense]|uniref:hydroxymethylpyrimidine kinase n=1 Tax=Polyangium jinanense TaxID=2829994 RepID=A0A9X4AW29_9BACT|nr:bifunctional hydroxymethylpyrimidine kinase/phosphomethylpyrimidine kinase [Polyangium jinanense]MDC3960641.1 bifunctional hydroxymethylpyrimidine kinase/phosphomethylpyrimidine kinase [Polyangium jinanense]MDC3986929.1 bifunctional hydroxymethylpyrimidine kinase/phosphomethylpyrimidine kinase [Polyangium jinanense]
MQGRVLIVAGSDSGGGAGIQADLKAVTALGAFGATAITALTAQNTRGVFGVFPVPPAFLAQQMSLVLEDIGADAIKTGMLHSAEVIDVVADVHERLAKDVPLVVDPVMVAKGGAPLLLPEAREALIGRLLPRAALITPNLPEAEVLSGQTIDGVAGMRRVAEALLALGPKAVLVKGGHLEGPKVTDVLVTAAGERIFEDDRIETTSTHGTGCTLASAIAAGIAQGLGVEAAIARARRYIRLAIAQAPGLGHGHGPLNHAVTVRPFD